MIKANIGQFCGRLDLVILIAHQAIGFKCTPFKCTPFKCTPCKLCVTKECTLKELHDTMGHCNVSDLLKLQVVVHGIKIQDPDEKIFCNICCNLGKMTHSAISKIPDQRAKKPLDMVHSDLARPIIPTAKDGFVYAIVFIDGYFGMTFHYFLRNKSDATRAMETFIADVAPIGKIKGLRTDGGGEYMSDFKDVLIKHGIKHQLNSSHTPQQNGTAERSWRTGFDMARCLLLQSGLPKYMWTCAVAISIHTRNHCYLQCTRSTPQGVRLAVAHSPMAIRNLCGLLECISMVAHRAIGNKIYNIMVVR